MAERKADKPNARKPAKAEDVPSRPPDLVAVRGQIDGIDRGIQSLIAERASWTALLARDCVVRPMFGYGLPDCLRITVRDGNRQLIATMDNMQDDGMP